MNKTVFSREEPDYISQMLGTRFNRFESLCGICGLAKDNGFGRLELLAVSSNDPGNGQFREFIKLCKSHYQTICVWHVDNPFLGPCLERYGFYFTTEISGLSDGEILEGYRWDKQKRRSRLRTAL
jgi:hypothetical protein